MFESFIEFIRGFFSLFGLTAFFLFIAVSINPDLGRFAVILCAALAGVIDVFVALKLEDRRKEREDDDA